MSESCARSEEEQKQIRRLNQWIVVLFVFGVVWTIGMFIYFDFQPREKMSNMFPIIIVDSESGKIVSSFYTNFPTPEPPLVADPTKQTNSPCKPIFEQKETYNVGDFVVIKYFYTGGIVVGKRDSNYSIVYRSDNRLESIDVPGGLLLSPTSAHGIDPFCLIR